jgi:hypothetical protein
MSKIQKLATDNYARFGDILVAHWMCFWATPMTRMGM